VGDLFYTIKMRGGCGEESGLARNLARLTGHVFGML
jgi:hypothetical protein